MPPKKRKSVVTDSDPDLDSGSDSGSNLDSDSEDDYAATAKVVRRKPTTQVSSSKKRPLRPPEPNPFEISGYVGKLVTPEYDVVQTHSCTYYLPGKFRSFSERCTSCIEKQAIRGSCRFVNLRAFKRVDGRVDYSDYAFRSNLNLPVPARGGIKALGKKAPRKRASKRATRSGPASSSDMIEEVASATETRTVAELKEEADYVLPLIAPTFAEQLRREQRHESAHLGLSTKDAPPGSPRPLIRILSLPETRSLCDACSTSIYMGGYLCGCCGLELCLGCWEEWTLSDVRGERGALRNRDSCSRRRRHIRDSMIFVTRASDGEISKLLERVERRIPSVEKQEQENGDAVIDTDSIPTTQPSWPNDQGPKYLPTPKTHYSELTLRQFQALWRRGGVPLVLTGFRDRFKLPWDPQYFINKHGKEPCFVHDCIDGAAMETTVAAFFSRFSDPTCIQSHKLKDWPPSADFSITFPKLFQDFESALPFPSYTARKGRLNLAAHFPEGYNAPDLGPKMYNAYPAPDFLPTHTDESDDVKGTTNLHLDLTDAMNIMLFSAGGTLAPESSTTLKGIPSCGAIWDIFPPAASSVIRTYLNSPAYLASHPSAVPQDDPIHRQCYYLTETDLTTLSHEYAVHSHRIFQEPGEAVFVPAGCCHQVRNRKSCVKVAVDFLTPENVSVCKGLVEEARSMAGEFGRGKWGKEDVLQLWGCLGFAWGFYDVEGTREGDKEVKQGEVGDGGDAVMIDVKVEEKADKWRQKANAEEAAKNGEVVEDGLCFGLGVGDGNPTAQSTRTEIVVGLAIEVETEKSVIGQAAGDPDIQAGVDQ